MVTVVNVVMNSMKRTQNNRMTWNRTFSYEGQDQLRSTINHTCATVGLHSQKEAGTVKFEGLEENGEYLLRLTFQGKIYRWQGPATSEGRSAIGQEVLHQLRTLLGVKKGPWGDLVGVRPLKLYRNRMERWGDEKRVATYLEKEKLVAPEKINLLQDIYRLQAPYMEAALDPKGIALYGGIPFCTSICSYCSFPFGLIQKYNRVGEYVEAFLKDINHMKGLLTDYGLHVDSAYLGGGTPTSLCDDDFSRILKAFTTLVEPHREYTVEAGRPDTINRSKIDIMKECGVNRVSLNPQTMQNHILRHIGRNHNVLSIDKLYQLIRKDTKMDVNMDFICGLPKQNFIHMKENMTYVCQSSPENVTIHTLTLKKGSPLYERRHKEELPSPEEVKDMVDYCGAVLREAGYVPYYLYRQQYMNGSMENIGYTLPSKECRYNIQMMEERLPIASLGPGSTSKWMRGPDFRQRKQYLPKDVDTYIDECERLFARRREYFDTFYRED